MSLSIMHSAALALPQWCEVQGYLYDPDRPITHASALLLSEDDARHPQVAQAVARWSLPLFIVATSGAARIEVPGAVRLSLPLRASDYPRVIAAARAYEQQALPPLTRALARLIDRQAPSYACPGHQGGDLLDQHPAGARFKHLLGQRAFAADVPHGAPELETCPSRQDPLRQAQRLAARVFGADETLFVLNGASTANRIVASALLCAGDLVLMDRTCHASVYQGALLQCGALPVYLDTVHDTRGILGDYCCTTLQEGGLRQTAAMRCKARSRQRRPFRLAVVQAVTHTGVLLDAAALLARIGHLCDYVLFDAGCGGHEAFIDTLAHLSPLAAPLDEASPGILVSQSVHRQMAGLSAAAQIHKQDRHIRHLPRYCPAAVFDNACVQHASSSLSYPSLMSLEINAAMFSAGEGQRLWQQAVASAHTLRVEIAARCRFIRPLDASVCANSLTEYRASGGDGRYALEPRLHYHDPCKVTLISDGAGQAPPIPAAVLVAYLRDNGFALARPDLYSFTLVVTPFSDSAGLSRITDCLATFEQHLLMHTLVLEVLPSLGADPTRYADMTLSDLCCRLNALLAVEGVDALQRQIFCPAERASYVCSPYQANQLFVSNAARWLSISEVLGRVAAQALVALPAGTVCIAPGERWTKALQGYLQGIETVVAYYPQFAPQVQGLHYQRDDNGILTAGVYVLE